VTIGVSADVRRVRQKKAQNYEGTKTAQRRSGKK
jgi:hypothetical protein